MSGVPEGVQLAKRKPRAEDPVKSRLDSIHGNCELDKKCMLFYKPLILRQLIIQQ